MAPGIPSPSKQNPVHSQKNNVITTFFERCSNVLCSNVILLHFKPIFARGYIFLKFLRRENELE